MVANSRNGTTKGLSKIRTDSGRLGKAQEKNRKTQTRIDNDSEYSIGLSQYKNNIKNDIKPTIDEVVEEKAEKTSPETL